MFRFNLFWFIREYWFLVTYASRIYFRVGFLSLVGFGITEGNQSLNSNRIAVLHSQKGSASKLANSLTGNDDFLG